MIRCHPDRLASENRSNFGDASHLPPYILSLVLAARNNLAKLYPGLCVGWSLTLNGKLFEAAKVACRPEHTMIPEK